MRIALFSKNNTESIATNKLLASFKRHFRSLFFSKASRKKRQGDFYHNLEISLNKVSDEKLFYSSFGTPARYLMEMYTRMVGTSHGDYEGLLLFNPFFRFDPETASSIAESIDRNKQTLQIISNRSGRPLCYFFPSVLSESEVKYLSLVSCMDASLDMDYLQTVFLAPVEVVTVRRYYFFKNKGDNGFNYNKNFERIYSWVTDSAIKALRKEYGLSFPNPDLKQLTLQQVQPLKSLRDNIPFTAIMPHHAGDVLFMSIAFDNVVTHVTRIILSDWYGDILRECAPHVHAVTLPLAPTSRQGSNKRDEDFFWDVVAAVPEVENKSSFYYYWRPSREYRISDFHLIDHFAFAMGASFTDKSQFVSHRHKITHSLPPMKGSSYRVLLHFEGGWPLKRYPPELQERLIDLFYEKGFEITVLTARDKISVRERARLVKYERLSQFKGLLGEHNILIGMDSFPIHYAAHIMGSPAICLFGNTKPVNSDAELSDYYGYLCNEMSCAGCFGFDRCPESNDAYCKNFPEPEKIVESATTMLKNLYGKHEVCNK